MNRMVYGLVFLAMFPLVSSADERFDGSWDVIAAETDGKRMDEFNFAGMQWRFEGKRIEIKPAGASPAGIAGKPSLRCRFEFNDKQSPRHFDWTWLRSGGGKAKQIKAIYELKEQQLRISFTRKDGDRRPQGFDTTKESTVIYTLNESIPTMTA